MFWYLAVLISNSYKFSLKSLKFGPKWQFLYFKPISLAIFVTIAMVKFKSMLNFNTSVILLINQSNKIREKQFSVLGPRGIQISPLMHIPLCRPLVNFRVHVITLTTLSHTWLKAGYVKLIKQLIGLNGIINGLG